MAYEILPLPPPLPVDSGYRDAIARMVSSGVVFLGAYPGSGTETFLYIISGIYVRIFEGFNATYLFNTPSGVIRSSDFFDWTSVNSSASSITQIDYTQTTVIFKNLANASAQVYTQKVPEVRSKWTLDTTLSGMTVADSAGEPDALVSNGLPIIVGNSRANVYPRVVRSDQHVKPIDTFVKSDAGIPQTTPDIAQITDFEAV